MAIRITKDTLGPALKMASAVGTQRASAAIKYMEPRVESRAKTNAPWQDQTGNARQGLKARGGQSSELFYIDLFHTMPYGIWLEVRWSGRFATIMPTVIEMGPEVARVVGNAFVGGRGSDRTIT